MSALSLSKNYQKILVVGPIYDRLDKLLKVEQMMPDYDYTIVNGNLYYKFCDLDLFQKRLDVMDRMIQTKKAFFNLGDQEIMLLEGVLMDCPNQIVDRLYNKPNVIFLDFDNQSNYLITSGGITPKMTKDKLADNLEVSFVSNIGGTSWHELYNGNMGYVISNNPLTYEAPKFHRYSAQIGNYYGIEHQVYAQEIDKFGLKETISI